MIQQRNRQWLKIWIFFIFGLLLLNSIETIRAAENDPGAGDSGYYQDVLGKSGSGSGKVGIDGSATYIYPMELIKLFYNSNQGWFIEGYSVISRSGRKGVPLYTMNDLFELDGKELVYIGGSDPREYRTKRESWQRIKYYRPETSNSYWIVERPDGSKLYYGNDNASQSRIEAVGGKYPVKVRAWAVDTEYSRAKYDVKRYFYEKDPAGDFYLIRVESKKNNASTPSLSCKLTYEPRIYPKLDCRSGCFILTNKVLKEVEVYRGLLSGVDYNGHLKTYVIDSQYGQAGEWQVKSVTPWGAGAIKSLPATSFEYYNLQPKFRDADPSTPNVIDPVRWLTNDTSHLRQSSKIGDVVHGSHDFVDINGDGLPDRIAKAETSSRMWVLLNNGGFCWRNEKWWTLDSPYYLRHTSGRKDNYWGYHWMTESTLMDMNGDCLPDFVTVDPSNKKKVKIYFNTKNDFSPTPELWDNTFIIRNWTYTLGGRTFDFGSKGGGISNVYTDQTGSLWASWFQMLDMNGDGRSDIIERWYAYDFTKRLPVYINNGHGIDNPIDFTSPDPDGLFGTILRHPPSDDYLDMNGDGLPDRVVESVSLTQSKLMTLYNTGYSFDTKSTQWTQPNKPHDGCLRYGIAEGAVYDVMDINGDGLPDRLWKEPGKNGDKLKVWLNMGYNSFTEMPLWSYTDSNSLRKGATNGSHVSDYLDMNGDGLLDRVYKESGKEGDQLLIWFNDGGPGGKLKAVHNPLGGTTEYSYKPIDKTVNPDCKPSWWVVDKIAEKDGLGQSVTKSYEFGNGVYDAIEREFLGFGEIKLTQPTGEYSISLYHNSNTYLTGKPINTKTYNLGNGLMDETLYEWDQKETATGVKWAYLKKSESRRHDGDPSVSQKRITEYQYDNYGNPTVIKETGDSTKAGVQDLKITQNWYNNDTTNWNLGQLRQTGVVGYDQNRKLTFQRSTYHNYDSNGNLVKTRNWLEDPASPRTVNPDGTTNPASGSESNWVSPMEYFYDTYGNLKQVKDSLGNSSYTTYDSKFGLYPIKQTNALGHIIWSFYDSIQTPNEAAISAAITRGWLVKTLQAQTGINIIIDYDFFGRPVKKRIRGYTDARPSEETSYSDAVVNPDGTIQTPACVAVGRRHDPAAVTPNYLSYTYSDGMGRTIQVKAKQSEGSYSTIDTYYEISGYQNRTKVSVPYETNTSTFSARDTAQLQTVTTDWLGNDGRYTTVTGTDSSVITTRETRGSKVITDARGNSRLFENNAFGFTESIYQNSAPIQNTYLTGNGELVKTVAGEIVSTIEYNSLGQKIKVVDPDLGTITYTYDANGNLIKQVDANGKTVLFQYDVLNRPTKVTYNGFNYDEFIYDEGDYATGKLSRSYAYRNNTKMEENQFKYTEYGDILTHTHWIDGKSKEIQHIDHDGLGRIKASVYPTGEYLTNSYHPSGWGIDTIVQFGINQKQIVSGANYGITGQLDKLKLNDNQFSVGYKYWEYDQVGAGLLKGIETAGIATNFKLGYSYDRNGNVIAINDGVTSGHSQSFNYDTLNQLVKADGGTLYSAEDYQYDSTNGNLIKKAAKNLEYGLSYYGVGSKPHAVKDDGSYIYRYDAAGNLSERLYPNELPEQLLSIPRGVFHYSIYGQNNVTLNDRVKVRNYHGGWAPVGCYGTVQLGAATYTGSVTSAWSQINLRGANIYGDAQTRGEITMQYGSKITGVSYPNTSVNPALTPEIKVLKDIDFTGVPRESKVINSGSPPVSLNPGKYWDYTVNSGATLKLKSGVYYFNSLITNSGSIITLDEGGGAIKIYVQTQLQLRAKLSHSEKEPYGAAYLFIGYLGTQDVFFGGNDGGTFAGSIVAPKAKIIGGQESTRTFQGMYIARTVEFHQDSQITCVPFFGLVSQVNQYSYDEKNRLLEIKQNYFTNMTSVYGATGERIKKIESSTDSYYFFPEYEEDYVSGSGAAKARNSYYFAFGKRVAKKDANGFYTFFINDHLGSTSQVVDDSGAVVKTLKYLPYGETVLESGTHAEDYKFNGKELDQSGLYYYGARFYNPATGRFITADTVTPGNGFDLLGLNRYGYCRNNPVKYVDPTGHTWETDSSYNYGRDESLGTCTGGLQGFTLNMESLGEARAKFSLNRLSGDFEGNTVNFGGSYSASYSNSSGWLSASGSVGFDRSITSAVYTQDKSPENHNSSSTQLGIQLGVHTRGVIGNLGMSQQALYGIGKASASLIDGKHQSSYEYGLKASWNYYPNIRFIDANFQAGGRLQYNFMDGEKRSQTPYIVTNYSVGVDIRPSLHFGVGFETTYWNTDYIGGNTSGNFTNMSIQSQLSQGPFMFSLDGTFRVDGRGPSEWYTPWNIGATIGWNGY